MKYCRSCKTRASETETVCAKCGRLLATLGGTGAGPQAAEGANPSAASTAPALSLMGQITQLEALQTRNLSRRKQLAIACAAVLLALLATGYIVWSQRVLSYAVLENIRIEQSAGSDNEIRVSFDVVQPGKVAFDRQSGTNHTEKLDVFTQPGPASLAWRWPSDPQTGIDFQVVSRGWLTRTTTRQHFNVSGKTSAVDIVFLLDTTASMTPFIEGLKSKCIDFAEIVRREGHDCRLGLIGFGDVNREEPMYVFEPTRDLQLFQSSVGSIPRTDGGDEPESSVEALERALRIEYRPGARVCFIHITDATCHREQQLIPVSVNLDAREIMTYVVSRRENADLYRKVCVQGGDFYAIEDADFEDILVRLAQSVASQIGYQ